MNTAPYMAAIDRQNPTAIVILLDQSGSMQDPIGGSDGKKSKATGAADAINRLLSTIITRASKEDGIRHYYDIGVIGYGSGSSAGPAFIGPKLKGRELVSVSELAENPARVEDRTRDVDDNAGGIRKERVKFPVFFDPVASNGTPMCEALRFAHRILADWVQKHPNSFPPVVINLTDGEATDGNPTEPARAIRSLSTSNGNVLLFNCHISSRQGSQILYPDTDGNLPDEFARLLFDMSSELPSVLFDAAAAEGLPVKPGSRGFVFQADLVDVIRFLDIGTRSGELR